jgi:hypothetical protein
MLISLTKPYSGRADHGFIILTRSKSRYTSVRYCNFAKPVISELREYLRVLDILYQVSSRDHVNLFSPVLGRLNTVVDASTRAYASVWCIDPCLCVTLLVFSVIGGD